MCLVGPTFQWQDLLLQVAPVQPKAGGITGTMAQLLRSHHSPGTCPHPGALGHSNFPGTARSHGEVGKAFLD